MTSRIGGCDSRRCDRWWIGSCWSGDCGYRESGALCAAGARGDWVDRFAARGGWVEEQGDSRVAPGGWAEEQGDSRAAPGGWAEEQVGSRVARVTGGWGR